METFEELGLEPELVEALTAEGIERPTALQCSAIPVVRRGNNLVLHAGPGAGVALAYGAGLLGRIGLGGPFPKALVVQPSAEDARLGAQSLARIAEATGHRVAAIGSPWANIEHAHVVFGTARALAVGLRDGPLAADSVEALVVDSAAGVAAGEGLDAVETLLEFLAEGQRVLVGLPFTSALSGFADRHVKRAVHLPPQDATGDPEPVPRRGEVKFRVVSGTKEDATLELLAESLASGALHLAIFFATEERAADLGDHVTVHGWDCGRPGDPETPVWLAVDEIGALDAVRGVENLAVVSFDVPAGPDSLDRRHGGGRGGTVLVKARELAHLRDLARRTGYRVAPAPRRDPAELRGDLGETMSQLREALSSEDVPVYAQLLGPLLQEHDATEIAAAALALLRRKSPPEPRASSQAVTDAPAPPAWVRLFVSVGERDGLRPGDLVGAITGEVGVDGSRVGKIELRDTFSLVEVHDAVAGRVIEALNGTTIRGRSARVDYDRGPAGGAKQHRRGGTR